MLNRAALVVLVAGATALEAQAPDPATRMRRAREALAPIQRIVGQWEGEARAWEGPGDPIVVRQHEDVVFGAQGTVIQIRGTGRDPGDGRVIFAAAAALWFDLEENRLRMRTHRDGNSVEAEVEIRPDTIVWGFPAAGGRVRYVIALTDSTWYEVGTFTRAGMEPARTLEMRLRRSGPPR